MPGAVQRATFNTTTSGNPERKRYVDEALLVTGEDDYPLLKVFGIDGEEIGTPTAEWIMDELGSESTTLAAAVTDHTATTMTVAAGTSIYFTVGVVAMIMGGGGELVRVTAAPNTSTHVITVSRGFAGTTARDNQDGAPYDTAYGIGGVLRRIGVAAIEGSDTPLMGSTIPTLDYNNFQMYDGGVQITVRQQNTDLYGVADDLAFQKSKAMKKAFVDLENSVIYGIRSADSSSAAGMMGGFPTFITTNATNGNGAAFEESAFNDMLQALYVYDSANMAKLALVGPWLKRKIASWYQPAQRYQSATIKGGVKVDQIETDFGLISIKMLPRLPGGSIYLVNPEFIKVHPFKGSRLQWRPLAVSGAYTKEELYGDYTLVCKNQKTMAKGYGFSTTS